MAKVLVIEDERNLRLLYQQDLQREGYEVLAAADAREGLNLAERERQAQPSRS